MKGGTRKVVANNIFIIKSRLGQTRHCIKHIILVWNYYLGYRLMRLLPFAVSSNSWVHKAPCTYMRHLHSVLWHCVLISVRSSGKGGSADSALSYCIVHRLILLIFLSQCFLLATAAVGNPELLFSFCSSRKCMRVASKTPPSVSFAHQQKCQSFFFWAGTLQRCLCALLDVNHQNQEKMAAFWEKFLVFIDVEVFSQYCELL